MPIFLIKNYLRRDLRVIERIIQRLVDVIHKPDYSDKKLFECRIVQIDETMTNYKCKSHSSRSSSNRAEALCIVEVINGIIKVFATVVQDKTRETILLIILSQVAPNSTIRTDGHGTYICHNSYDFRHDTVCHKFNFINQLYGANTQAVESFHNK
ncbi:hypothetical protein DMUE_1322 [Dictyocoela muelleri]|nr:hypothetical protein DMUE_1322 [Dictyocoela muelleri]